MHLSKYAIIGFAMKLGNLLLALSKSLLSAEAEQCYI